MTTTLHGVVDLGGTNVRAAVADGQAELKSKVVERTTQDGGADGVMDQIARIARQAAAEAGTQLSALGTIVVASPGPLNSKTGIVFEAPNLPGWVNIAVKDGLESRLGCPVRIVNDANAAAMGEFYYGAGRDHNHLVYMTVSTGIGGGVVTDGRLLEGSCGTGGEIGHMTIDRHGPVCKCGNIGCLEMIASGTAIGRNFRAALAAGRKSKATEWVGQGTANAVDVVRAAGEGDPLALEIFNDAADAVGTGVVNCVNIFNPDVVAIGGGVSQAGDLLFDTVRRVVSERALPGPRDAVKIVPAALAGDVGLVGAAAVALHG